MKIAFVGDMALIGRYDISNSSLSAAKSRFSEVIKVFDSCDYVIANLETPLTDEDKTREFKTLALRSPTKNVRLLKELGIDAVSIANNHIYDYGVKGVNDTVAALKEEGIEYFGIDHKVLHIHSAGEQIVCGGFCCYTTNGWHYSAMSPKGRLNTLEAQEVSDFIKAANTQKEYPIFVFHWGEENTHYPKFSHIKIAKKILDEQEGLIVGHHPHVVQGLGTYKKGMAAYSLGNFCFDDSCSKKSGVSVKQSPDNLKGAIFVVDICNHRIRSTKVFGIQDIGDKIILNAEITGDIEQYSKVIESIENEQIYESKRKLEISKARTERLNRRGFGWLVHHLNLTAIMAVLQRKTNQQKFRRVIYEFENDAVPKCKQYEQ